MSARIGWFAVLILSTLAHADTTWLSDHGHYRVSFTSDLDPIVINRMHHWQLEITDREGNAVSGAMVSVDGGMPAHDHGLPTRPQVVAGSDPGRYRLEGLRFHMGGRWEVELTIEVGGMRDIAIITLDL